MNFRVLSSLTLSILMALSVVACGKDKEKDDSSDDTKSGKDKDEDSKSGGDKDEDSKSGGDKDEDSKSGGDKDDDTKSGGDKDEIPKEYKGEKNPNKSSDDDYDEVVKAGKALYDKKGVDGCSCHGSTGSKIKKVDFTSEKAAKWEDDWMLWRVSEGTSDGMPAFKNKLDKDEIWKVITYVRTLAESE